MLPMLPASVLLLLLLLSAADAALCGDKWGECCLLRSEKLFGAPVIEFFDRGNVSVGGKQRHGCSAVGRTYLPSSSFGVGGSESYARVCGWMGMVDV